MKNLLQVKLLLVFYFFCISLNAQNYSGGLRFDYSIDNWTFRSTNPFERDFPGSAIKPLNSLTLNFPLQYKLNRCISLQTELGFARRGFSVHFSNFEYSGSVAFRFRYINLPIYVRVFLKSGKKQIYILAGPSISRTIGATIKAIITPFEGPVESDIESLDLDDFPRTRTDYGMNAGFGWVVKDKKTLGMFIETRYYYGMKRLSEIG